jgi:hypothetical protein
MTIGLILKILMEMLLWSVVVKFKKVVFKSILAL